LKQSHYAIERQPKRKKYNKKYEFQHQVASEDTTTAGLSSGTIVTIVTSLCGFALTKDIETISWQLGAAALRLSSIAGYTAMYGARTVRAEYVAVGGGSLIIQRAQPGLMMAIRAANMVS